ncbi:MAG TPA: hypothetical protein VFR19_07355 [Hyphomicrobiaceae bacterium]|nr:hypothetical protein [Hyphomicrobiaceae bacterium]
MEGFDVKAALDALLAFIGQNYLWLLIALCLLILFRRTGVFARVRGAIEKALIENWQLTLLGSTGVALSLASAYTTWDGLRNFTRAPLLSLAIAFGIQGVMLIVAWLIGESFAVGMNQRAAGGRRPRLPDALIGMGLGLALVGLTFYWALQHFDAITLSNAAGFHADLAKVGEIGLYFLIGLVLIAIIGFGSRRGGDISTSYAQSLRLVVKNAVLWVMFLSSMAASVFFSFDSHFNAIFPAEARARAAEIRTTSQIGSTIADIGALAQRRQLEEADRLFETAGWKAYDKQLAHLSRLAQESQGEIERYFVAQMEERRRAINEQQERIATSHGGQAGLASKKLSLTDELSRLKAERPTLAAEYAQHRGELDAKAKEIDGKRIESMAEDRGVEGSMKQGKGPIYRQRLSELAQLNDQYKIKQERTKDAYRRLNGLESRLAQVERELTGIDGDLAKFKGEAETAEQRIKATLAAGAGEEDGKLDPARVLPGFERARAGFRQQPTTERLAALQQQCSNLVSAMSSTEATKGKLRGIDCDPKQAAEAAGRVFALNAGIGTFQARCAGGDRLNGLTSTDALLGFGRGCLQDSGLISKDSAEAGARLAAIEMNRDDKAHRFVVTWNAFLDGNRLAYLALILAIGVDSLVFMSGLFGAQALRSPLSDVPSPKARSAEQLQAVIDTALLPHTYENARIVLNAMRPMAPREGFTQRVTLRDDDPHAPDLNRVLNAGATIGAVRHVEANVYELRSELFEYLSLAAKKSFGADKSHVVLAELERIMAVSLLPNVRENVETVLRYVHPIEDRSGFFEKFGRQERPEFTAEIRLDEVDRNDKKVVRNALNAGATLQAVERANNNHYFISRDFYKALARIRAHLLISAGPEALQIASAGGGGAPPPQRLRQAPQAALPGAARGSVGEPRRLMPRLAAAASRKQPSEADLKQTIWGELLSAIGLTLASASRIAHGVVREQAAAACRALDQLAQGTERLRGYLSELEEGKREALVQKYNELRRSFEGDERGARLLEEVAEDLERAFKALLLLPEAGLLQELIEHLEEAGQSDGGQAPGEQELLGLLRAVEAEIGRIDKSRPEAWKTVLDMIEERRSDAPTHSIRELDPANKQPI